jgi:DNA-binding transcriptional LysR family regulator
MDDDHNLRHLQVVSAVAKYGGVHRAAERINLSQPAISQAVNGVERAVGEILFDRVANGMVPTDAGRIFARRIDQALGYLKSGRQSSAPRRAAKASAAPLQDRPPTTVQLRALIEVIERGGYAQAARHLGIAQPSVYRAIRDLERVSRRTLFQSSPSGASPTADALLLARWANLAFREISMGLDELRELRGLRNGSLIIGALPVIRTLILPAAVTRLLAQYPDAKIEIVGSTYAELLNHLQDGRADLIVGALRHPAPANNLHQEELFREPLSVVVRSGHPLLAGGPPDLARLAALEWIAPHEATPSRASFAEFFRKRGYRPPQRIIECSCFITMRDLLIRTDRAALLSASQIHYEARAGELAIAVPALPGTERAIGICTRLGWSPTKVQSAFLSLLREVAREVTRADFPADFNDARRAPRPIQRVNSKARVPAPLSSEPIRRSV